LKVKKSRDGIINRISLQRAYRIIHSRNPIARPVGQITFMALRDIAIDKEICYNYAMIDGTVYDEFECHCCSPDCRGKVSGNDWQHPALRERYAGYFSPYLQHLIDKLHLAQTEVA
jgi:hypothetical protein